MKTLDLDTLIGVDLPFYGMCGNAFKLGGMVVEAIEDESDGYRSSLKEVRVVEDPDELKELIFDDYPIAHVRVEDGDGGRGYSHGFVGHSLVDIVIEHTWAQIGTANNEDYYPWFVAELYPLETGKHHRECDGDPISVEVFQERVRAITAGKDAPAAIVQRAPPVVPKITPYADHVRFGLF